MNYEIRIIASLVMIAIYAYVDYKQRKIHTVLFYLFVGIGSLLYLLDIDKLDSVVILSQSFFLIFILVLLKKTHKIPTGDVYVVITLFISLPIIQLDKLYIVNMVANLFNLNFLNITHVAVSCIVLLFGMITVNLFHYGLVLYRNIQNTISGHKFLDGFNLSDTQKIYAAITIYKNTKNHKFVVPIDVDIGNKRILDYSKINNIINNDDASLKSNSIDRYVWPFFPAVPFMFVVLCFIVIDFCIALYILV